MGYSKIRCCQISLLQDCPAASLQSKQGFCRGSSEGEFAQQFFGSHDYFAAKVSSDLVTEEAWQVLLPHLLTGAAPILSLESVFDVLRAANYLQMDEAQTYITDYIKAHISKADFLDAYNFARQAKIDCLTGTIETTIVRPEEVRSSSRNLMILNFHSLRCSQ